MPTLDDLFNEHEAEQEAKPAPAPKPSAHGLTPLIDAAFAQYEADRQALIATVRLRANRLDHAAIREACRDRTDAYRAFLDTPEAKAELAALAAYEAALPDDEPDDEEETDDWNDDEEQPEDEDDA